jgi:hypothetical protein
MACGLLEELAMRALALVLVVCAGCNLDGTDCFTDGTVRVRDPETGACTEAGTRHACRYCASSDECLVGDLEDLDLGLCELSGCRVDSEASCLELAGCRASYLSGSFLACWRTAPSGPPHSEPCAGLDAHACSRHDDCAAWYVRLSDGSMLFERCLDEAAASSRAGPRG